MNKRRSIAYFFLVLAALAMFVVVGASIGEFPSIRRVVTAPSLDFHSERAEQIATAVQRSLDGAQVFELSNGLQVVAIPDPAAPYITNMVWYKAGGADDPPGKSGLAHFVEHLTFAETDDPREREFSMLLENLGERQDALTTYDYTVYHQTVKKGELESVIALEAHRMAGRKMESVPLAAERQEVLDERREFYANPESLLDERIRAALYGDHPYGRPVLGLPNEFDGITADDVSAFYRRRYVPNNAIVVLHGPFNVAMAKSLVDRYFAAIPHAGEATRGVPVTIPRSSRDAVVFMATTKTVTWRADLLAPSYTAGVKGDAYALQVLSEMLGGCSESRLRRRLLRHDRAAASVEVFYEPESLDLASFSIIVKLTSSARVNDVATAAFAKLRAITAEPILETELAHAKRDLKNKAGVSIDRMPPAARLVGEALAHGRRLEDVQNWRQRVDQVSIDEIRQAARALLLAPSVTGVLADKSSVHSGNK